MPYVSSSLFCSVSFIGITYLDSIQDLFSSNDLIRSHDKEKLICCEYTIFSKNIEKRMFGEKRLRKID